LNYQIGRISLVAVAVCAGLVGSASAAPKLKPGVTSGFFAHHFQNSLLLVTGFQVIQEIDSIQPGQYIANATVTFESSDPKFHRVECAFVFGTDIFRAGPSGDIGGDTDNRLTLPMTIGFVYNSTKRVAVGCRTDAPNVVRASDAQISIIRVDEMTFDGVPIVLP
jgi:hypothetical protein